MLAGQLNKRITILSESTTVGKYGGRDKTYTPRATVWANVEFSGASRNIESGKDEYSDNVVFTIRKIELKITDAIDYAGERYYITSINPTQYANQLVVICSNTFGHGDATQS